MLKRILHKLLGYKIEVSYILPVGDGHLFTTTKVVRCHLSSDCIVRCKINSVECYLEPDGTIRGLPTEKCAKWKPY